MLRGLAWPSSWRRPSWPHLNRLQSRGYGSCQDNNFSLLVFLRVRRCYLCYLHSFPSRTWAPPRLRQHHKSADVKYTHTRAFARKDAARGLCRRALSFCPQVVARQAIEDDTAKVEARLPRRKRDYIYDRGKTRKPPAFFTYHCSFAKLVNRISQVGNHNPSRFCRFLRADRVGEHFRYAFSNTATRHRGRR